MSPSRLKEVLAAAQNGAVAYSAVTYTAVTYSAVPRNSKRYRIVALNEIARVLVSR